MPEYPSHREAYLEKPLPSDETAERVTIGAILLDNRLMDDVAGQLASEDFYSPLHRRIFEAMMSLYAFSKQIDPITIGNELKKEGSLEALGGISTITNMTFGLPHFSNIQEYIEIIKDKSMLRQLVRICNATTNNALSEEETVDLVLDQHEQLVYEIRSREVKKEPKAAGLLAEHSMRDVAAIYESGSEGILGIPTGFIDLDQMTSGRQKGDLIISAARPSMGKTAKALQEILNATAFDKEIVVFLASLEMSERKIAGRLVCMEAKVDSMRYRVGKLMSKEWEEVAQAVVRLQDRKIIIDDTPHLSVLEIKAKARKIRSKYKRLDLIVVDHFGLMKGSGRKERHLELGEISKGLKAMAKELDVPVIALCQLSRKPENRTDPKPMTSDLRQSGEIEEDADVVELLYRPGAYKDTEENEGIAEVIIGKNRDGPTGIVKLSWLKQYTRFENFYQR